MAETSFNLSELFEKAFGYRTTAFEPQFETVQSKKLYSDTGAPLYATDAFSREYYLPVIVSYPSTNDANSSLLKWELPYPVVSITGKKTIIETPLVERKGTAKELISAEDYRVTIKGFAISKDGEFPEAEINMLRRLYELNTPLSIQSALTDLFLLRPDRSGSDQLVITEISLPVLTGVKNIRPYELKLVSDAPFDLVTIS